MKDADYCSILISICYLVSYAHSCIETFFERPLGLWVGTINHYCIVVSQLVEMAPDAFGFCFLKMNKYVKSLILYVEQGIRYL